MSRLFACLDGWDDEPPTADHSPTQPIHATTDRAAHALTTEEIHTAPQTETFYPEVQSVFGTGDIRRH